MSEFYPDIAFELNMQGAAVRIFPNLSIAVFRFATAFGAVVLITVPMSGCSPFRSTLTAFCAPYGQLNGECRTERQARATARDVWDAEFAERYCGHHDPRGLRAGFIDGFVASCKGNGDSPPMFAPSQNGLLSHGNKMCSTAWHNGYPMGAAEAAACGCQGQLCPRVHPCLVDVKRPVNPGCIRIPDYQLLSDSGAGAKSPLTNTGDENSAEEVVPSLSALVLPLSSVEESREPTTKGLVGMARLEALPTPTITSTFNSRKQTVGASELKVPGNEIMVDGWRRARRRDP